MDNFQDFKNALANLEMGWTGVEAFEEQKETLLTQKKLILKNKKALKKEGYDVIDIYKQLDEFDDCIKYQIPITDDYEEKILLAALEYANANRPIICSKHNQNIALLNSFLKDNYYIELPKQRYKYDVSVNLIAFYISYREQFDVFEVIKKFLTFNDFLIKTYPREQQNFYSVPYTITYLKYLIKIKEFDKARFLLNNFIIKPIGKTDTTALEKIKLTLQLSNDKS